MRVGSLFAGIGGFDLAARRMGWRTVWYSEIEPYASAVMSKQFPDALNLGDVRNIDGKLAPPVDMIVGGFPCQDISLIGRGAGLDGERSGLWTHYARLLEECAPTWVVIENVASLRTRGLDEVLGRLAALGYDAEWHCIPASFVGAPHRRDRIWIVAHAECARLEGHAGHGEDGGQTEADGPASPPRLLAGQRPPWRWAPEPTVGRVGHGIPARVDRIRCLGNSVVPQVAEYIFKQIEQQQERLRECK